MTSVELGGILLTGGSSSRMGVDKATIDFRGALIGQRTAELLIAVVRLAVEVGSGVTTLPAVQEHPVGQGPLAAVVAGRAALIERGLARNASCIVLACDLPLLTTEVLVTLSAPPLDRSLLPMLDGTAQPLCARWSAGDLDQARRALAAGQRSLRGLPDRSQALLLDEGHWGERRNALQDADTPEELERLRAAAEFR